MRVALLADNTVGSSSPCLSAGRRVIMDTMTERERNIVIGCILGDGFLQTTGKRNARLRLEHSLKQKAYIEWKWDELRRYMQDRPTYLERFNPVWRKRYQYLRCQSHSSPQFGKLQEIFYGSAGKKIPKNIAKLLRAPLTLAVWFMDDGYYYGRDRTAYIYLSPFTAQDVRLLLDALARSFNLHPKVERKKTGALNLKFSAAETRLLIRIIAPHVVLSMRYKIGEEPRID